MITDASKAVVLAGDQDEAKAAWSGQAGVDATLQGDPALQGTRRRGALDRGGPASSVPEHGAGSRGSRTPTERTATGWASRTADHRDLLWADHRHPGLGHRSALHRECLGWGWAVNDGALSQALPLAGMALTVRFLEPARVVGELGGGLE